MGIRVWQVFDYRLGYCGSLDLAPHLPPNWLPLASGSRSDCLVELRGLEIFDDGQLWTTARDTQQALQRILQLLQMRLTWGATHYTFLHAGVVGIHEGAWLIPAEAGAGKSRLVEWLVSRGGRFYSDELAVIDDRGLVPPYPRDLWLRISKRERRCRPAQELGWTPNLGPLPLERVLLCRYRRGAVWSPRVIELEEARPQLWAQIRCAPEGREQAWNRLAKALRGVALLQGLRGEADDSILT